MKILEMVGRVIDPMAGMMRPPPGMEFDFSQPKGEPALVEPESLSWRIFKNPVTLFIGGVAAVILELGEPSVRSGIWDHSAFRQNAPLRLRRSQHVDAKAVGAVAAHHLDPVPGHVHLVVGEHAVEVECDGVDRGKRRPRNRLSHAACA